MIYELKDLKITMKVKKEYYIYPLLSLVSDFGHFPFLLDRAAQMGSSDLTRVWEGYILGYGAKMGHYPRINADK